MSTATEVNPRLKATHRGRRQRVARSDPPLADRGRRARADGRRGVAARRDLEPVDLREGDPRLRATTTRTCGEWRASSSTPQAIYERIAIRDVQLAADVLADVHRESNGRDGFVSLEVAPGAGPRHRAARSSRRARTGRRVDRPNVMIKIPGTPEGVPRDRAGDLRGHQRQRHAAVRGRGLRGGRRGLHPRRSSAATPRDSRSTSTRWRSFFVSRVDTQRRPQARGARAHRPRRARRRWPTRAPRTAASRRSSPARAGRRCATPAPPCSGRCGPRPGPRTRTTPTRCTSTSWSRRTPSTRCRWRRCWPSPTTAR